MCYRAIDRKAKGAAFNAMDAPALVARHWYEKLCEQKADGSTSQYRCIKETLSWPFKVHICVCIWSQGKGWFGPKHWLGRGRYSLTPRAERPFLPDGHDFSHGKMDGHESNSSSSWVAHMKVCVHSLIPALAWLACRDRFNIHRAIGLAFCYWPPATRQALCDTMQRRNSQRRPFLITFPDILTCLLLWSSKSFIVINLCILIYLLLVAVIQPTPLFAPRVILFSHTLPSRISGNAVSWYGPWIKCTPDQTIETDLFYSSSPVSSIASTFKSSPPSDHYKPLSLNEKIN